MENKLVQKLNELGDQSYDYLRLSSVYISKKDNSAIITFIYLEEYSEKVRANAEEIIRKVKRIIDTKLNLTVKLEKSCFFANAFREQLMDFFESYPSIILSMSSEKILIENKDDVYNIDICLPETVCEYAKSVGLLRKIREYFSFRYLQMLNIEIKELATESISTEYIEKYIKKTQNDVPVLENEGGRVIAVTDKVLLVGGQIDGVAAYISDAHIGEAAVHCGTIDEFSIIPMKPKSPEETTDKKFFKFKLKDFTGVITCLYFPSQKNEKMLMELCDGKSIIAFGRIVEDSYDKTKLLYMVKKIMFCTLPAVFSENRKVRKVAEEYITVFPQPYIRPIQSSLFDVKQAVPAMLKGKRFCVFDLETTGLDPKQSEIIEIGALIIDDGVIRETFSSFISIEGSVPEKITQLTGIDDSHLAGQPHIKDVLADFYKFSHGLTLVGQNVSFDYGFISEHGAKYHMHFDNNRIDTIVLARKYLKNMRNFTLKSITERLEITNNDAHRALSDAIATAEVFIKLAGLAE